MLVSLLLNLDWVLQFISLSTMGSGWRGQHSLGLHAPLTQVFSQIIRKHPHKLPPFPVLGCTFLHCLSSSADNIFPYFSSRVLDLFLNISVISLQCWGRHAVKVWVSFSFYYSVYEVTRICALLFFLFYPTLIFNWLTIKEKKNHLFL